MRQKDINNIDRSINVCSGYKHCENKEFNDEKDSCKECLEDFIKSTLEDIKIKEKQDENKNNK